MTGSACRSQRLPVQFQASFWPRVWELHVNQQHFAEMIVIITASYSDLWQAQESGHTSVFLQCKISPWLSFKAHRLPLALFLFLSLSVFVSYRLLLSQRLTCPRVSLPPSLFLSCSAGFLSNENCALCMQKSCGAPIKIYIIPSCTFILPFPSWRQKVLQVVTCCR